MLVVVAGVIRRCGGEILLAQRPPGVHMAGLWELPGGKVRDGESPPAALIRELREELGIETEVGDPVTFAVHEEPGRRILLLFYNAEILAGEPQSLEGQALAWVPPRRLVDYAPQLAGNSATDASALPALCFLGIPLGMP
jgi:8-oxo-dGTP diphosphatase